MDACTTCKADTASFYDVVGPKGLILTVPCCRKCFKAVSEGMRPLPDGGLVHGQVIVRYCRRDYKPVERLAWAFMLAKK